ncbi:shikimate dehydrogenase (NADP(+)) [Lentibacillus kapialis]|uniref:Shikimate dehydrogenase (NADP(+)) n=1 Tax=Lentibacillus kapialis TaxID=340214 RepID=A0A917UT77_9BACI|nr:shikimate dehydrogenase [Lentibacillus kapialis]GGJ83615.1 shikimate dehydrogenase (NADP(+)) [Lentibacillus kapialis]
MKYKLGLIGYPIKQSMSPWIHKQFLKRAKLEGDYSIQEINPDESFAEEIVRLRNSRFDGFNVTVPYKKRIMQYLDQLDEDAQTIGAVNTVVCRNGKWMGYNTDWIGFITSLKHHYPSIFQNRRSKILLIGAGGAARGIYYGLLKEKFTRIDIANRTHSNAEAIAELAGANGRTSIMTLKDAENNLESYDLIIQTTNIGMKPNVYDMTISLSQLHGSSIVSDIVYQPINTEFLYQASQKGASIHYGHTMLLYQAQYAFELWTSKKVPVDDMEEQLRHKLEGE